MLNLLRKEIMLTMHPSAVVFVALGAMLLIPNYPYLVVFFYTALGLYTTNVNARENNDVLYSLSLPITKRDLVKGRMLLSVVLELAMLIICVPVVIIKQNMNMPNQAGLDANIALLGFGILMLGLFNLVYYCSYFKNTKRAGITFIWGCIAILFYIVVVEGLMYVPQIGGVLDTPDSEHIAEKLVLFVICLIGYAAMTWLAYKKGAKSFEKTDV